MCPGEFMYLFNIELETSSLELFVLVGFVLGDRAGDAVRGGGRGCWCILIPNIFTESFGPPDRFF